MTEDEGRLIRLEAQLPSIQTELHRMNGSFEKALMEMNRVWERGLDEMKVAFTEAKGNFVTKEEHRLIQALVYGGVSFVLLAVLGAVVALVIQRVA